MPEGLDIDEIIDVDGDVQLATRKTTKKPNMYKVVLYNDDYTTMEFVVEILITIFNKPRTEAVRVMLDVHKKGKGICGVYTYDIAVTKVNRVHRFAQVYEYPLKCGCEEA
ncbi:MAG: ATP-dependent Clp protease adapter ClpS [Candidatus Aminicenantes bacterium]|nr:ATP-dependent Clp protease adapter ClpS [Candidatus Aminicenantes bacterium]